MDPILVWLEKPLHQAVALTTLLIVLAGLAYWAGRRRVMAEGEERSRTKDRLVFLALGVASVLLLVLGRLWSEYGLASGAAEANPRLWRVVSGTIWTLFAGMLVYAGTRGVRTVLLREATDISQRHKIRRGVSWAGALVFLGATVLIWANWIENVSVFLGIVGAGVALSLQEILLCIAGWALLVLRKPFDIGARVEIDNRIGDVIDINIFHTTMLEIGHWVHAEQSTGRLLLVPNSAVFRHSLYNYTKGFPFLWNELSTLVTFESDWKAAKALMLKEAEEEAERMREEVSRQIREMQGRYAIRYDQLTPIVYTSIADNGVRLTLRYLSPVRQRRSTEHRISEDVLAEFLAHPGIDFAYPTTRFYDNTREGKPALGGPASAEEGGTP